MKYHDSIQQDGEKAAQVKLFLQRANLAAHPVNYAVCYEYISGHNSQLCQIIEQKLSARAPLNDFIMADLYSRVLAPGHPQQELMLQEASGMVSRMAAYTYVAAEQLEDYVLHLEHSMQQIQQTKPDPVLRPIISQLQHTTAEFRVSQQQMQQQLLLANQQSHQLRHELEQLKQQRLLDPLTGLYNRLAMQNQLDIWFSEQQGGRIAAIAVNLDEVSRSKQSEG